MTLAINLFLVIGSQVVILFAVALALTVSLYLFKKHAWLVWSCAFLVVSQFLIFSSWESAKYGTISNTILFVAIVIAYHRRRFHAMVRAEANELFSSDLNRGSVITAESLQGLPPIVRKWLIRSNIVGRPAIQSLCIKQKGEMRMNKNGRWLPFRAEQFINANDQGFIWNASISTSFFFPISARDKYLHGHGNMLIKCAYALPVADSSGREIDQGTLMRFLAEMIWFPTAALANYIRWDYLSETSATATIDNGRLSVSGTFTFDSDGDVKGFEGMRYREINHHYALQKWIIAVKSHRMFAGMRVADKSEVSWQSDNDTFTWLKLELSDMIFSYGQQAEGLPQEQVSEISERI
jgi:hypothetical protein